MADEIYQDALIALLGGALPVIVPDPSGDLHLYTLLPGDEMADELMQGELRTDFVVKTVAALHDELERAGADG